MPNINGKLGIPINKACMQQDILTTGINACHIAFPMEAGSIPNIMNKTINGDK